MSTAPHIPPPPQGPGVHPPFPAPPVEGRGKRLWLSLAVGAGVLVLVCGGGIAAVIGVVASSEGSLQERAEAAVGGYLDALRAKRYDRAYDLLCEQAQQDETEAEFRTRVSAEKPIERYAVGKFALLTMSVPVRATYTDGQVAELEAYLGQDQDTGAFEVCNLGE